MSRRCPSHPLPLVLALGLALPALAQTEGEEKKDKTQLETVVITAERRVENIKDVPNAVSKLSGEKLDVLASGGQDVRVRSGRAPTRSIESTFGRAFPRFYLRGYGNNDFRMNASQPVSLIYDEVVQEAPILKGFPVFDVANVEVLAGPQGTLFGRNTPGGVVKFESVKPSQKQNGYASISLGSQGMLNLEGAFNLPLGGDWAARISAQAQHRKDWVTNTLPNAITPKTEGYTDAALRIQALYEPHKQFSALFNLHHRDLNGSPRLFRANIIKEGSEGELVDGFDPKKAYFNGVNKQLIEATGGSARLRWDFGDAVLHSITALETIKPFSRGDIDGGAPSGPGIIFFQLETSDQMDNHRQWSQEVRLESKGHGVLRWQGGLYLFDEAYDMKQLAYDENTHEPFPPALARQTNRSAALFGAINYDLTRELKLRAGLRYTKDRKELTSSGAVDASNGLSNSTSDSKWNWDLSATYALDKDVNLYARYATGYRGSAMQPATLFAPQTGAKPEDVRSVEFGIKGDFWQRKARLSASVYDFKVKNQQLTAVGGDVAGARLLNASKSIGRGFEMNLDLLPTPDLLITAGFSLNKAEYRDPSLRSTGCGAPCTVTDPEVAPGQYSMYGNQMVQAPKRTANLTARWTLPLDNGDELYVYTDWVYRSKMNMALYESREFTAKALTEGGLRVGYLWGNGQYEAAAFVRNLTDRVQNIGQIDFINRTGMINEPRSYGLQFKALF